MPHVVEASRRVLLQVQTMLCAMEKNQMQDQYTRVCPLVKGSIGQHVRHSLDHFDKLLDRVPIPGDERSAACAEQAAAEAKESADTPATTDKDNVVAYDKRVRGSRVELDIVTGFEAVTACSERMARLALHADELLPAPATVEFSLSSDGKTCAAFESTVARELWFVAHHSIHHQAMIKLIAECHPSDELRNTLPKDFGLAPSTAAFRAKEDATDCSL